ncbi:MAG: acetoacetate--CoA ligase [Oceanococcus sp.]
MPNTAAQWTPSTQRIAASRLSDFSDAYAPPSTGRDYANLHAWSLEQPDDFWSAVWDFAQVIGDKSGPVRGGCGMPGTQFFPEAQLNFAENLLERGTADSIAIRYRGEDGEEFQLSRAQLKQQVASLAAWMRQQGISTGDRVAAMMPNRPETIVAMLATTSLGAVWSSCSPDFGQAGVLDRFGQIKPKLFIACASYHYGGKQFDTCNKAVAILSELENAPAGLMFGDTCAPGFSSGAEALNTSTGKLSYQRVAFNAPLYILFSSGTTGVPKCIVHGVGGTLLQHLKEHQLQADIHPGDAVFYYSTCGWMMWNWLVSALASEATVLLFDGSPFHPTPNVLFDYIAETKASFFGVSAKYIDALKSHEVRPAQDLSSLRSLASTGSPLLPESFDYIYQHIKADLAVQSISGGTDIVSCFVLGNPWQAVQRGQIQCAGLGMAVDVCDEQANTSPICEKGDLICRAAFPSMPIGFWNDDDQTRYRKAYFSTFEGIWHHGDYAERTAEGGFVIHGRSDATLNPGGVRIGTAEIYRQVEQIPAIAESLAVGQNWQGDVRVVLFVTLQPGHQLNEELSTTIRKRLREFASPRHVPAKIIAVPDLPRTRSGKLAELAVRDVIEGRPVKNQTALANAQALDYFSELEELK